MQFLKIQICFVDEVPIVPVHIIIVTHFFLMFKDSVKTLKSSRVFDETKY